MEVFNRGLLILIFTFVAKGVDLTAKVCLPIELDAMNCIISFNCAYLKVLRENYHQHICQGQVVLVGPNQ